MDRLTVYSQLDQIEETPCFSDIRLTEIRVDQEIGFRHVDTKKNPADLASRRKFMDEMVTNDLWWQGSKWLQQLEESWPNGNVKIITPNKLVEMAKRSNKPMVLYEILI